MNIDYLQSFASALKLSDPLTGLSHGIWDTAGKAFVHWHRTSSRYGEFNRYSKDHQDPISIDRVPVLIPQAVKEAKHTEYKHAQLHKDKDQIRLLELLPAVWSKSQDYIACRLVAKKLSETPQYEALSYTWGTLARDVPIYVVPNPLPQDLIVTEALLMTPSLYSALTRLRQERTSRYLWVDQLCMDQTNNKERCEQVLLMDKIYQQSKRTIIWLGEEDENRWPVEEMIGLLSTDDCSPEADVETVKSLITADGLMGRQRQEAITGLLNRDWFTRAW